MNEHEHADEPLASEVLGGGVQPKNTRERLLFTAIELFYSHGIHAVGLDRILNEAGLTKTTFYKYFESKDELVVEALEIRDQWESDSFMKTLHEKAGYDPKGLLLACFDVLDDWFTQERFRGCLFMNTLAEYPTASDPVHRTARQHYENTEKVIRDIAKAAGVSDPEALAFEISVLMMGAISHRLAFKDGMSASGAKRIAEARIEAYLQAL